jgi:hypothetical protein
MKQKLLLLAMGLFAAMGTIKADNVYFSVDKVDVMQGKSAKVSILYNADGTKEYKGAQVEFIMPDGLTVTSAELGAEVKANNPEMSLQFNPKRESDNHTVFVAFQIALTPMPMGEGVELFSFTVEADEDVDLGEYPVETLKIEFASDEKATFGPETIIFNVIPYAARVLEDTATDLPEASEVAEDVIVKRTVKAGVWSTICLPFEMSADQVKEVFGEGARLANFVETVADDEDKILTVKFETVDGALEANHPYVLKSENELTEIPVSNVLVTPDEEEAALPVDNGKHGKNWEGWGIFYGTLKAGQYELSGEDDMYAVCYIKDNKFYYNTSSIQMNAYRGYFEFYGFEPAAEGANICFTVDGEATAIEGINIKANATGDVYNVNGMYMGRAEDVMKSLPRGIYVINNKKVVVK